MAVRRQSQVGGLVWGGWVVSAEYEFRWIDGTGTQASVRDHCHVDWTAIDICMVAQTCLVYRHPLRSMQASTLLHVRPQTCLSACKCCWRDEAELAWLAVNTHASVMSLADVCVTSAAARAMQHMAALPGDNAGRVVRCFLLLTFPADVIAGMLLQGAQQVVLLCWSMAAKCPS